MGLSVTLLNRDMHPLEDLTPRIISGSLVFNNTSGRTRTAEMKLKVGQGTVTTANSAIWDRGQFSVPVATLGGTENRPHVPLASSAQTSDTSIIHSSLFNIHYSSSPLALLLPTSSTLSETASGTVLTLRLSDKYALLDGTLGGILDTDLFIPSGSSIPGAITSLLAGYDPLPPVFAVSSRTEGQFFCPLTRTGKTVPAVPFGLNTVLSSDIRIPAGKPVSTAFEELADHMGCTCAYDPSGRLLFTPSSGIHSSLSNIHYSLAEHIISRTTSLDLSSLVNDVLVLGATVNNRTFTGRAENTDPATRACISRIGRRTRVLSMPDYASDDICASYARRILRDYTVLSATETYVLSPEAFPLIDLASISGYTLSFCPTAPLEVYC